jgi:hypothetical protein
VSSWSQVWSVVRGRVWVDRHLRCGCDLATIRKSLQFPLLSWDVYLSELSFLDSKVAAK